MNAWSSDAIPAKYLHERTPLERQGALVFQNKQCRNCHEVGGQGGQRGPALDSVATRLTEDQIVRQVLQGGGNMPAYGNALSPAETTALVAFLKTLNGNDLRPAQDASRALTGGNVPGETLPGQKKPSGQPHLSKESPTRGKP
jgi:ubiquinol-cytochrome c reductase cytochrome b subunit